MSKLNFLSRFQAGSIDPSAVHSLIETEMKHDDWFSRGNIARNPLTSKEQMDKLLAYPDAFGMIAQGAAMNPRYKNTIQMGTNNDDVY